MVAFFVFGSLNRSYVSHRNKNKKGQGCMFCLLREQHRVKTFMSKSVQLSAASPINRSGRGVVSPSRSCLQAVVICTIPGIYLVLH